MRCNEFDIQIDEMLSGILHPEASQHMRQCERCASHFRARSAVQRGLRQLASVSAAGPSRATDRAVMESYRRLQQRRAQGGGPVATPAQPARLFAFPSRKIVPFWASRTLWGGAAAAAVVVAMLGSAVHLWHGSGTVNAPVAKVETAPPALQQTPAKQVKESLSARATPGASSRRTVSHPAAAAPSAPVRSAAEASEPLLAAKTPARHPSVFAGGPSAESGPVTEMSPGVSQVVRLASSSSTSSLAQSASSTWPGYSNLMYCDPVVCSGPMQVVHIKVPVDQVKPSFGQADRNAFVSADVVVGPDGVARAIRVAN
jgi:hypothetical protein